MTQLTGAPERTDHTNVHPFPAIAPGHHLAPVEIRRGGNAPQVVFVPCADWCVEDHVTNFVHFIEDVDHKGAEFSVSIPSFWSDAQPAYELSAAVASDPMSSDPRMRAAHIVMGDSGSVDAYLTPDMADDVADDLENLAAKMREHARTARLHNQHVAEVA